jgi:hypothetical protein
MEKGSLVRKLPNYGRCQPYRGDSDNSEVGTVQVANRSEASDFPSSPDERHRREVAKRWLSEEV